ncbi:bifunctional 3'-5' exonuclease/DNA polymerase [soil metagenome]
MFIVLARIPVPEGGGRTMAARLSDTGGALGVEYVGDLAAFVAREEPQHPRWVWDDTGAWYPELLAAGIRVERCFDLRLCNAILRSSALTSDSELARAPQGVWDAPAPSVSGTVTEDALFELETPAVAAVADPLAEFTLQRAAVAGAAETGRIQRLLAAESAGALIAAEMRFAGLPWRADAHDALLQDILGPRPPEGLRPRKLQDALDVVRERLEAPDLNPDSPADLLRALGVAGLQVTSTRSWELKRLKHPAIPPLLEYKKLARLLSANGWHWLDTWVVEGRFRPDYVPGGVVTGRWATSGGGALQLPKQVRGAVIADPGWKLVVADASQLEPRILAALAADRGMVEAGAAGDLYAGIVASGAVETRDQAKIAMLGAMYGATTGESGRLMPRLARAYPRAIALVEEAARAGERGEVVTTRLGRSSPPGQRFEGWNEARTEADTSRARERARSWGRFTRNFVVQGTAAEWALCWMAGIRRRLRELDGGWFTEAPHLVFFLHDEVVVHTPAELAGPVRAVLEEAAAEAGRLLFGELPVTFPLTIATVDNYGEAK